MDLTITKFKSCKETTGTLERVSWSGLVERLKEPTITCETVADYQRLNDKTSVKDVGAFVGGEFRNNHRSKADLLNRSIIAIDADEASLEDIADFRRNPCTGMPLYFCHTTHSSTAEQLRLRWFFPLARPVTAPEYTYLVHMVSQWVGGQVDWTTDQPERLMFWPSVSLDADYQYWEGGIEPLDPDRWLSEDVVQVVEEPEIVFPDTPVAFSSGSLVEEGSRNTSLHRYGVSCTLKGIEGLELLARMRAWNDENCVPPLEDEEVVNTYKSVQTNGLRPVTSEQDFSDMGEYVKREDTPLPVKSLPPPEKKLQYESVMDLLARDVKDPEYIVKDLITIGLTVVASPPKYGKSWLSYDMCFAIASGTEFLGLETKKSKVLYLALEDSVSRFYRRLKQVRNNRDPENNFMYSLKVDGLNEGLIPEIEGMRADNPDLKLIIIDTLQKVRGTARKTEGVYGYDYRELGLLQEYAMSHELAIILIHHLNKGGDDSDFVSRLNGSMGLSGAADSIITMTRANRGDDLTKMSIVGRDVMERTLMLRMDWAKYRWECLGDERDFHESEEEQAYHTSGLIKAVQYKMDELEDTLLTSGEELDEVTWQTDGKSLRDFVNTNQHEDITSNSTLRNKLESFKPLLLDLAAIRYNYDVEAKKFIFKRSIS